MKILSLDTSMAACSAAIVDTSRPAPLAARFAAMERGHAEALAPMVAEVFAEAGLSIAAIDRIAVTTGPGTFTGVRIGLAFARGLGVARGLPVIGIDSLAAIAANEPAAAPLLVVADARNAEVYAALYGAAREVLAAPHVSRAAEAAAAAPPGTIVAGTAAASVIAASGRSDLILSTAGAVPVAARFARLATGETPAHMPSPLYLRAPDAKPQAAALRKISILSIEAVGAAPLLASLHAEAFGEGWTAEAFAALLATPGTEAVIAREGDEPVAFLLTRQAADEAEVITIGTRPALQRRGAARQLLARHLDRLAAQGTRTVFLEVAEGNAAARALYAALGFGEAGRRKGYYARKDGAEDAIVMRRELAA